MSRATKFFAGLVLAVATSAHARDDLQYVFCQAPDRQRDVVYFSQVFQGDYENRVSFKNQFYSYLQGRVGADVHPGYVNCFYGDTRSEANSQMYQHMSDARQQRGRNFSIREVNWRP